MNSPLFLLANKLDINLAESMSRFTTPFGIKIALFISDIGSTPSLVLLTIGLCLLFWLFKKPYHLIQFLSTLGFGFLVVYLIKILVERIRPVEAVVFINGYSFPSGHATIATIFCFLIIFSYKSHIKNLFLKILFTVFFALSALAISFSRIYLSVHYLSDVIVGILLGLLISSISVFIFENFVKKEELM